MNLRWQTELSEVSHDGACVFCCRDARTVIGGQTSRRCCWDERGNLDNFIMNDGAPVPGVFGSHGPGCWMRRWRDGGVVRVQAHPVSIAVPVRCLRSRRQSRGWLTVRKPKTRPDPHPGGGAKVADWSSGMGQWPIRYERGRGAETAALSGPWNEPVRDHGSEDCHGTGWRHRRRAVLPQRYEKL